MSGKIPQRGVGGSRAVQWPLLGLHILYSSEKPSPCPSAAAFGVHENRTPQTVITFLDDRIQATYRANDPPAYYAPVPHNLEHLWNPLHEENSTDKISRGTHTTVVKQTYRKKNHKTLSRNDRAGVDEPIILHTLDRESERGRRDECCKRKGMREASPNTL